MVDVHMVEVNNLKEFLERLGFKIAILNASLGLAYPSLDLLDVAMVLVADRARPLGFILLLLHGGKDLLAQQF